MFLFLDCIEIILICICTVYFQYWYCICECDIILIVAFKSDRHIYIQCTYFWWSIPQSQHFIKLKVHLHLRRVAAPDKSIGTRKWFSPFDQREPKVLLKIWISPWFSLVQILGTMGEPNQDSHPHDLRKVFKSKLIHAFRQCMNTA